MYRRGSITVFLGMTIVMVLSIFFSLIEVIHVAAVKGEVDMASELGIESLFADYNRVLWKDYGILAVDGGYGNSEMNIPKIEDRVLAYADDNANPASNSPINQDVSFVRAAVTGCGLASYGLISDNSATPFVKLAAKSVLSDIPETLLDELVGRGDSMEADTKNQRDVWELIDESKSSYEAALEESSGSEEKPKKDKIVRVEENPLDSVESFRKSPILSRVISEGSISNRSFPTTDRPSKRSLNIGTLSTAEGISACERALFPFYIKEKFQRFGNEMGHGGISYEWEYLLCGKDSDYENLEAIVVKLLAIRSAENLTAIMSDPGKLSEATTLAAAIAAATLNPAIAKAIEIGLIAAWAYLEAVLDVRLLLFGGKVSLVKTPGEWTSRIAAFSSYLSVDVKAKECAVGFDYEDYLMMLTITSGISKTGMRALDVLEDSLRSTDDYAAVRVDNMIYCANIEFSYESSPIFLSFVPTAMGNMGKYNFYKEKELSYL